MKKLFDEPILITQKFSENPDYYSQWGFKGHEGIDCIPQSGQGTNVKVYAIGSGIVVRDTDNLLQDPPNRNYGKKVVILNQDTRRGWWYCHLESNRVTLGQKIEEGEWIGIMGETGNSTGKHVHLAVRETDASGDAINTDNGYKGFIDPLPFLETDLQKELDKVRARRDELFNMYDELLRDIEGYKSQIKHYEDYRQQLGTTLGVASDESVILGEVVKFVGIEDKLRECQKERDEKDKKLTDLTAELDKKEKMISDTTLQEKLARTQLEKLQGQFQEQGKEIEKLKIRIESLMTKEPKKSLWERILEWLH